jgi:hypothetical protein
MLVKSHGMPLELSYPAIAALCSAFVIRAFPAVKSYKKFREYCDNPLYYVWKTSQQVLG